jgi:hypothetical protein
MLGYVASSSLSSPLFPWVCWKHPPPPPHFPCFPRSNVLYLSVQSSPPPTMYVMGVEETVIVACLLSGGNPLFMSYIFFKYFVSYIFYIAMLQVPYFACWYSFLQVSDLTSFPPPYQETLQGWGGGQHHHTDMYVYIYVGRSFIVCIAAPPPHLPKSVG